MVFLDTHVVIWLYENAIQKLSPTARKLIETNDLQISAAVTLELQFLYEINRITIQSQDIVDDLHLRIGLSVKDVSFLTLSKQALPLEWTRDPFDRLIVANALINQSTLITKDSSILKNYEFAVWERRS